MKNFVYGLLCATVISGVIAMFSYIIENLIAPYENMTIEDEDY